MNVNNVNYVHRTSLIMIVNAEKADLRHTVESMYKPEQNIVQPVQELTQGSRRRSTRSIIQSWVNESCNYFSIPIHEYSPHNTKYATACNPSEETLHQSLASSLLWIPQSNPLAAISAPNTSVPFQNITSATTTDHISTSQVPNRRNEEP